MGFVSRPHAAGQGAAGPQARMRQVRMTLAVGLALCAASLGAAETRLPPQTGAAPETVWVTDIRYSESSSSLTVEVEMSGPPSFTRGEAVDPPRAYVDIDDARVPAGLHNKVVPVGSIALERIRIAQHDRGTVRVVLDLTPTSAVSTFRVLEHPYRLAVEVVSLADEKAETGPPAAGEGSLAEPTVPAPAADTTGLADIRALGGRVSIHAEGVRLDDLLDELDSVAGTDSTVAPSLESYRVDAWVDDLPVDQAVAKLFEGRHVDYAVIGRRRIVVLGMSGEGTPFAPALPAAAPGPTVPAVPAQVENPICRLPQGGRYAVGATPAFEDAYYLCASVLGLDAEAPRAAWVLMESSDAGLSIPGPTAPGDPCTLPPSLSYAVGAVVQQAGAIYRCAHVLDDNLDPAGTAWVTSNETGN